MSFGGGRPMGGILGGDFNDPRTQGILGLAGGLLTGGGPSVGRPISIGQALGMGLNQGQTALNAAQARMDRLAQIDAANKFRQAQFDYRKQRDEIVDERNARLDAAAAKRAGLQVVGGNLFDVSGDTPVLIETPGRLSETVSSDGALIFSTDANGKVSVRRSSEYDAIMAAKEAKAKPKTLSNTLQKAEDADFEALETSSNIVADTQDFINLIESGDLSFSFGDRAGDAIALSLGASSEEILNRSTFDTFLQRLRNATLRLNKGTQTEGDAERALEEIVQNRNNTQAVKRALEKLLEVNERAIENKKRGINRRRSTQGIDAFDFSDTVPPTSPDDVGFTVKKKGGST